jgi:hypothetical protein
LFARAECGGGGEHPGQKSRNRAGKQFHAEYDGIVCKGLGEGQKIVLV